MLKCDLHSWKSDNCNHVFKLFYLPPKSFVSNHSDEFAHLILTSMVFCVSRFLRNQATWKFHYYITTGSFWADYTTKIFNAIWITNSSNKQIMSYTHRYLVLTEKNASALMDLMALLSRCKFCVTLTSLKARLGRLDNFMSFISRSRLAKNR